MDRVRVGVAGVGHWATTAHLPAITSHPHAELVAIADPDPARLERARRRFGVPSAFGDPFEMLAASDLDAVVIATPHATHFPIAAEAIRGGRHVLVEKPFVLRPEHGRELMQAAAAAGVEIIVGYPWHYNTQALTVRRWVADGQLGTITFLQSFFGSSPINLYRGRPDEDREAYGEGEAFFGPQPSTYSDPQLAGGGQGQTQLTHSLALLLFLTGLAPTRVAAFMERQGTAIDVVDALSIRFAGGALGVMGSTGAVTPLEHTDTLEVHLHGSAGHLHFEVMDGRLRRWTRAGAYADPPLPLDDRYPMYRPATNLIDVALGAAANGSPATIGQQTVELLHAAYRSAEQDGAPMDVGGTSAQPS